MRIRKYFRRNLRRPKVSPALSIKRINQIASASGGSKSR